MAVYTETIKLVDDVSEPAEKASAAVLNFGQRTALAKAKAAEARKSLGDLATGLSGVGKKAMSAAKPLENLTALMFKSQDNAKLIQKADAQLVKQTKAGESEKAKASSIATAIATKNAAELANKMSAVRGAVGSAASGIKSAFASLASGDVIGAIGGVTDALAGMAKLLDLLVPGLGEAVSAMIQLAGGAATLVAKLAQFAVASTEAKQASISLWGALGAGVTSGEEIDGMLDGLREKLGVTKDDLGKYATQFLQMGVNGKEALETLTTAAVSAEAIVKGGGDAFAKMQLQIDAAAESGGKFVLPLKKLTSQLADMGLNAGDVAKQLGMTTADFQKGIAAGTIDAKKFGDALSDAAINKGAGPLERMSNSVGNLGKLFKEYLGDIFEDMGAQIGPLMKEVKSFFETFSQANPSGQAIKAGLVGALSVVFANVTKLVPLVKHFFLDMVILSLKAYIALMPLIAGVKEFINSATGMAVLASAWTAVKTLLLAIAVVIGVVVVVALAMWAAMIAVSVGVWAAVGAILSFTYEAGEALTGWVSSAATAAYNFVAGLVAGITNGAGQVISAVTGLASSATGAFKSALGIKSPSRVMMALGDHTGTGFAMGLEDTAPDVHGAASAVAGSAVAGASSGGDASSGGKPGGSNTFNVTVTIDGAGKDAMGITREMVSSVFESMALGAGV